MLFWVFFNVYDERSAWQKSKTAERGVSFKSGLPQKDHAVDHAQVTPSVITYLRGKINPGEVILLIHVIVSRMSCSFVKFKVQKKFEMTIWEIQCECQSGHFGTNSGTANISPSFT